MGEPRLDEVLSKAGGVVTEVSLRLFAADCAEHVLHLFEREYPEDKRPRQAIEATRAFARGEVTVVERDAAWAAAKAAKAAAEAAAYVAEGAGMQTAAAAAAAARAAARAAAYVAEGAGMQALEAAAEAEGAAVAAVEGDVAAAVARRAADAAWAAADAAADAAWAAARDAAAEVWVVPGVAWVSDGNEWLAAGAAADAAREAVYAAADAAGRDAYAAAVAAAGDAERRWQGERLQQYLASPAGPQEGRDGRCCRGRPNQTPGSALSLMALSTRPASAGLAFLVFGRVIPGAVFVFLATVHVELLAPELKVAYSGASTVGAITLILNRLLFLAFVSAVALIYVFRKPSALGRRDPITFVVAMYASFILLALRPVADLIHAPMVFNSSPTAILVSNVFLISGVALAAYSLAYLRFNFSILPEARAMVTGGPYRLVRHPVYLGEIIGGLGLVVSLFGWLSLAVLVTFIAAQLYRTYMEEGVLVEALPGYAAYRLKTPHRLIPGVI